MPPKMGMAPETGNGWAQRLIYSIGGAAFQMRRSFILGDPGSEIYF
jgi:hypothetical protein